MIAANLDLLLIGVVLGLAVALAGALIEYRLHLRRAGTEDRRGMPLLLVVAVFLSFLGVVAIVLSLILTESIAPALVMGIGVGVGFNGGFLVMLVIWLLRERARRSAQS